MTDFNIEYVPVCSTTRGAIFNIGGYKQEYSPRDRYEWSCTCKGFQFRHTCKHITEAAKSMCSWNSMWDEETQTVEGVCPRCGADTVIEKVAV